MGRLIKEDFEEEAPAIVQVPESFIMQSATVLEKQNSNNIFIQILQASDEFKKAGMTPIYLLDKSNMSIRLITAETYGKALH